MVDIIIYICIAVALLPVTYYLAKWAKNFTDEPLTFAVLVSFTWPLSIIMGLAAFLATALLALINGIEEGLKK